MPRALYWFRRATAAVMSTTIRWLVWALVDLLASIFREMALRIPLMASVRVPRVSWPGTVSAAGAGAASAAAPELGRSSVVILPLGPVPVTPERSMPWTRAWLAASGVTAGWLAM